MSENKVKYERIKYLLETAEVKVSTIFNKVTLVAVKLENGFCLTESSGCVDVANYDENIGKEICMKKIEDKLWELEGYMLQEKLFNEWMRPMTFGDALEYMKAGKKVARRGWNGKGMFLFVANATDLNTDADLSCIAHLSGELTQPTIVMKTADDKLCVGWLASQTDMLSEDWEIV